jgi:GNAT superfamily N-acetyltransferase
VRTVLVVANETLGGRALLTNIKDKAAAAPDGLRVVVCVPRTNPRQGNIIYDEAVFDAAQVRIDLARKILREEGIDAIGEVGDPDPYTATMDAIAEHHPDEIVISTYPAASSGWLRRDLIERISEATSVPVEHVVVDLDQEGAPFGVTLAVANRTLASPSFLEVLKARAAGELRAPLGEASGSGHVFIFVVPQEGGHGIAARQARARLTQVIDRARAAGLICAGMIADPDPYNAVMNAVQFFRVDDIVISTLPATRSGWLRADLIERVRRATYKPVEHVEATDAAEAAA